MRHFVDVILPLPLEGLFTYLVPEDMMERILPGCRLSVPFGRAHSYTALAVRVHDEEPVGYKVKSVKAVLDDTPSFLEPQMRLLDWIADYYMCPKGEVLKAMLPVALRPEGDDARRYKPRTEVCVKLAPGYDEERLNAIFNELSRARRQYDMLLSYLELSGLAENPTAEPEIVSKRALLVACQSPSAFDALVSKGVFVTWEHQIGRLPAFNGILHPINPLNQYQEAALSDIRATFDDNKICLLHGVTSSGKTEVYIHLIKDCIDHGGQALLLLPEIALTIHIMRRLQKVFGDDMCVYHSRCSDAGRVEIWKRQLSANPFKLIVGARSAVFLPFRNLQLTIVDEEHDTSYKQTDPAPRYNARNVAMVLSSYFGAKVLLGSATPSIESYYHAQKGKYGLAVIGHRYMDLPLPQIEIVDVYELRRKKRMTGLFSPLLESYIREALSDGNQVILFRNRRGYSPSLFCKACGWTPKCDSCDVSLTWHRKPHNLSCHYCGKQYNVPVVCPECGGTVFGTSGYGTEKVEDELNRLYPKAIVGRLDLDTVTSTSAYESILQDFHDGVTNILVGTQMVSKGLDFARVSVVGVLSADSMTASPDFRSAERAFQMMQQVSGRAGRHAGKGHVVVQTRQADSPLYSVVADGQYIQFYRNEVEERRIFSYPPFCRIIAIYMKCTDNDILDEAAIRMGKQLRAVFQNRVLGPDAPTVSRVQMQYIRKIMLKIETGISMTPVRKRLLEIKQESESQYRKVQIYFDMDPM